MGIGSPWHWAPYSWWAKIAVVAYPEICCPGLANWIAVEWWENTKGTHLLVKSNLIMVEMYGYIQPISRNIEIHMLQMSFIYYSFVKRVLHFSFIQDAFLDAKKSAICWPETASIGSPIDNSARWPFLGWQFVTLSKDGGWHSTSHSPRTESITMCIHLHGTEKLIGIPLTYPNNSFHLTTS